MSTQACQCSVYGSKGNSFTKTNTDDAWGEMVDANSLSLYQSLKGTTLTGCSGSYTAGAGAIRVRNTVTNHVKAMALLDIITEEVYTPFQRPFQVAENDVLEVFSVEVPT